MKLQTKYRYKWPGPTFYESGNIEVSENGRPWVLRGKVEKRK